MAKAKRIPITIQLREHADADLIRWLRTLPAGQRSQIVREALVEKRVRMFFGAAAENPPKKTASEEAILEMSDQLQNIRLLLEDILAGTELSSRHTNGHDQKLHGVPERLSDEQLR